MKGNNIWNPYSSRSLLLKQIEGHFYNRSKQELTLIHMMFSHQEMSGFCIDTLTMILKCSNIILLFKITLFSIATT